jgi:hypothetical protein
MPRIAEIAHVNSIQNLDIRERASNTSAACTKPVQL